MSQTLEENATPPGTAGGAAMLGGHAVEWPEPGRARLAGIEVPRCGDGEVTVAVATSVVSCGTERARYLGMPNARVDFPHQPGYAAAGVVIDAGAGVSDLAPGDQVALLDVPHQSVVTVPAERAYPVPPGVAIEDAAVLQLGVVAALGVRRAGITPGDPFAVIGTGLIGLLTQRMAVACGAGPCTAIAATAAKARAALAGGVERFLAMDEDAEAVAGLSLPLVIEATGHPDGLGVAVAAAASGGRVVLLGSPRGLASSLPVDAILQKELRVTGAHLNSLKWERASTGEDALAREAGTVLDALSSGRLVVSDLFNTVVDPREAARFYQCLASDRTIIGARFDWSGHPTDLPANGSPAAAVGRGRASSRASAAEEGPFAGATGHLRFALIGCGEIAVHNAEAVALAPNASLTACYDVNPELAADLAGGCRAWAAPSAEAALERQDVDAVILCVPHHLHETLAAQAADAGKHVIVEKPMAVDLDSAVRMQRAAERAGVALSVCFPQRYAPEVALIRAWLRDQAIGRLGGLEVRWYADKPPSYFYGGFTGRSPSTWRMRLDLAGGGVLLMNLCHEVELVRHLTGAKVDGVMAVTANVDRLAEVEDTVTVSVSYEGGAIGSFAGSAAARGWRQETMRIWGTDGHVEVKPEPRLYTLRALDGLPTGQWVARAPRRELPTRAIYVSRFVSAVTEGHAPDVTGLDGLAVQAFLQAAYASARSGRSVRPADLLRRAGVDEEGAR